MIYHFVNNFTCNGIELDGKSDKVQGTVCIYGGEFFGATEAQPSRFRV